MVAEASRRALTSLIPIYFGMPHVPAARMQAVEISQAGPPDVLRVCTRPVPALQLGEVLIRVAAAGVNRPDCLQRAGGYPPPPGVSDLPGLEVAGTVVAAAPGCHEPGGGRPGVRARGGRRLRGVLRGARRAVPAGAGGASASSRPPRIPETFFTVWTNVFERGRLQRGESLLVHGGASGIGTTAIQLGVAFGARVFATAGSDEKCALCFKLGAELAVNYRTHKFLDVLQAATKKRGVDVILDMVGGALPAGQHPPAPGGRPAGVDRGPRRHEGRAEHQPGVPEAPHADGLHPAQPAARREGPHRPRPARGRLAAARAARRSCPSSSTCCRSPSAVRGPPHPRSQRGHGQGRAPHDDEHDGA